MNELGANHKSNEPHQLVCAPRTAFRLTRRERALTGILLIGYPRLHSMWPALAVAWV